jgi:acetoin utilization deacetylase AcuC-like enzyme
MPRKTATTALIYHEDYLKHDTGKFHPERKERLIATMNYLRERKILEKIQLLKPQFADEEDLLRVHTKEHVDFIKNLSQSGGGMIDADTLARENTYRIAKLSAGGVMLAGKIVMKGAAKNSFALIRPPGHHATPNGAMGFCYFNNVAIAIRYLQENFSLKKVFLLDWDTHAFNGTMEIFYDDPTVLNVSLHQDSRAFYPGTGFIDQIGEGEGEGYTVNIPMEAGSGNDDYLFIMSNFVLPVIDSFKPQLIVISAGQDSHKYDPISDMQLTEQCYGIMTGMLLEKAEEYSKGRLFVELEGGYNLNALARSNYEIIKKLLGEGITRSFTSFTPYTEDNVMESTENLLGSLLNIFKEYHSF